MVIESAMFSIIVHHSLHTVVFCFSVFKDIFPNQDEFYGRQLHEDVWRDGEPSSADVPIEHPVIKRDENGVSKG